VIAAPDGKTLSGMLATGEIEALFTANVPQTFLDGSPAIRRLFPDYEQIERDYFSGPGCAGRVGSWPELNRLAVTAAAQSPAPHRRPAAPHNNARRSA
jgi:hypothetical protein